MTRATFNKVYSCKVLSAPVGHEPFLIYTNHVSLRTTINSPTSRLKWKDGLNSDPNLISKLNTSRVSRMSWLARYHAEQTLKQDISKRCLVQRHKLSRQRWQVYHVTSSLVTEIKESYSRTNIVARCWITLINERSPFCHAYKLG